ncbi:MAG: alpha-ketoglutarate-dependent dioxygenase AlkB [Bacteroidia bacterium]
MRRIDLMIPDGELTLYEAFYGATEADSLQQVLTTTIDWRHEPIRMFGRWVMQPRLTAWYGDEGAAYTYSSLLMQPLPWTAELQAIRSRISEVTGAAFNSVLLNRYRDGNDSMGWHSDDEKELGPNPVIASLSLGASRAFHLRHRRDAQVEQVKIDLQHGSLLVMGGTTQHYWQHCLPKRKRVAAARINLTFRLIG